MADRLAPGDVGAKWGTLPQELLLMVLQRVNAVGGNDIFSCMEVCKSWLPVAKVALHTLHMPKSTDAMVDALEYTPTYENLTTVKWIWESSARVLRDGLWDAFLAILSQCPKLVALEIRMGKPGNFSEPEYVSVSSKGFLRCADLPNLFQACPRLHTLHLDGVLKQLPDEVLPLDLAPPSLLEFQMDFGTVPLRDFLEWQFLDFTNLQVNPFTQLTSLRSLSFKMNGKLIAMPPLPPTFTNLQTLSLVALGIVTLPAFPPLPLLHTLDLRACSSLIQTPSLVPLPCLQTLVVSGCTRLEFIANLEYLTALKVLWMDGCTSLGQHPPQLYLPSLRELKVVVDPEDWTSPDLLLPVPGLQKLYMWIDKSAKALSLPPSLEELRLMPAKPYLDEDLRPTGVQDTLPSLVGLTKLRHLSIVRGLLNPFRVSRLHGLETLTNLRVLQLDGLPELRRLPSMRKFAHLERLSLISIPKLTELPMLPRGGGAMRSLVLRFCEGLSALDSLTALTELESLEIRYCFELVRMARLDGLKNLKCLRLEAFRGLRSMPFDHEALRSLRSLTQLHLTHGNDYTAKLPLFAAKDLSDLTLGNFDVLTRLPIRNLPKLSSLCLSVCGSIQALPSLSKLTSLRSLHIYQCQRLRELQAIGSATRLESLCLLELPELRQLPPLDALKALCKLSIRKCNLLHQLPSFGALQSLQKLQLDCVNLESIPCLRGLRRLRVVDLRGENHDLPKPELGSNDEDLIYLGPEENEHREYFDLM